MPPPPASSTVQRLPQPAADERAVSARLVALIRQEMGRSGGRLPFDRFMELALYAPGLGYYTGGRRKFGEAGDFVTAPEVSPLFARCLARQCRQVLGDGGGDILEFGAGSGILAADLLAELALLGALPERYRILELSAELQQRQRETLARRVPDLLDRVEWLRRLPAEGVRGVILANELLDALPVQRFRIDRGRILEQFVVAEGDALALSWEAPVSPGLEQAVTALGPLPDDYESEIGLRVGPWVEALAGVLRQGLALLIDYGHPRAEYYHPQRNRGTLMCHYRHRAHADPLFHPGLQDITSQVEFTTVAGAARDAGLDVCGYTTQAFFLLGCGLDRLVAASDPERVQEHMALMQGVKRLTLPSEMGERFKVLGLGRGLDPVPLGFSLRDMRERL
ncbi:MAG TPA: SAM-dependent methyltransferase [Sedimenticola thiotaurini]|uniref:SAM-dependent methyltransferase n=1 Tax=Sedimenticola thiotaurini TaxID=1543721 RepID=A0A831W475_9GAMM|nr:SAM-dependent methyltransferase [Sedimenticola thiotaurini]